MAKPRGIRRFLRFSLRSLLLVTLAVAAWLGYEVQQARTVERQAEAIRALGGEVEFGPSPWSLLRFFEPQTYGRRIAGASIFGERLDAALPLLKSLSDLRELRVGYDGTTDLRLNAVRAAAGSAEIIPFVCGFEMLADDVTESEWTASLTKRQSDRFAAKLRQVDASGAVVELFECRGKDALRGLVSWHDYEILSLPDGSTGELLISRSQNRFLLNHSSLEMPGSAVLLVGDRCVAVKVFPHAKYLSGKISIQDIDGDGFPELTVEMTRAPSTWKSMHSLEELAHGELPVFTDPKPLRRAQRVTTTYAIESTGFRCLLPEDPFKGSGVFSRPAGLRQAESGGKVEK